MINALARRADAVLDIAGLSLVVAGVAVLWGAYALLVAGAACLLLSREYGARP